MSWESAVFTKTNDNITVVIINHEIIIKRQNTEVYELIITTRIGTTKKHHQTNNDVDNFKKVAITERRLLMIMTMASA
jgi:hypothetical protein